MAKLLPTVIQAKDIPKFIEELEIFYYSEEFTQAGQGKNFTEIWQKIWKLTEWEAENLLNSNDKQHILNFEFEQFVRQKMREPIRDTQKSQNSKT